MPWKGWHAWRVSSGNGASPNCNTNASRRLKLQATINAKPMQGEALTFYDLVDGWPTGPNLGDTIVASIGRSEWDVKGVRWRAGYKAVLPWVPMSGDSEAIVLLTLGDPNLHLSLKLSGGKLGYDQLLQLYFVDLFIFHLKWKTKK